MVFTGKLTEEELMLQKKFALLKKKRIELQQKKRQKPPPPTPQPPTKKVAEPTSQAEARELAKKVLAAQAEKFKSENKGSGFKRSRHLERRLQNPDKAPAYQPFSPSASDAAGEADDNNSRSSRNEEKKNQYKNLYSKFVSGGLAKPDPLPDDAKLGPTERPHVRERKKGNTIYVHAHGITHDLCDKAFSKFGSIANISVEKGKNSAFVTFDTMESADKAIEEMNGNMVLGKTLKVSMARRQPRLEAATDMNSPWTGLATGLSRGPKHRDTRDVVNYEEDIF